MESSSRTSKRSRVSKNGSQVPSCLVDGCTSDLSKCRDYHRRHKVCEIHSKTAKVYIQGVEQRFCQQCSRFHSMVEFDEGKRSCRKRLEGHNRRRRKPQSDPLSINPANLFPVHQGARYLEFGSSQLFATSAMNSAWTVADKAENYPLLYSSESPLNFSDSKDLYHGSTSHTYGGGKQLPFVQSTGSMFSGDSVCQPLLAASGTLQYSCGGSSSQKALTNGLNLVRDSNCALSLLSSPPANNPDISLSHLMRLEAKPPAQSLILSVDNNNCLEPEPEPVESVLVSHGSSNNTNLLGQDLYQIAPAEPSASGTHQMLSFSWE